MSTNPETIKKLKEIYILLKENKIDDARKSFEEIRSFVDSKEHLELSDKKMRFLVWEFYEFLILDNTHFTDRDYIVKMYQDLFSN